MRIPQGNVSNILCFVKKAEADTPWPSLRCQRHQKGPVLLGTLDLGNAGLQQPRPHGLVGVSENPKHPAPDTIALGIRGFSEMMTVEGVASFDIQENERIIDR